MCLETLKGTTCLGGFAVLEMNRLEQLHPDKFKDGKLVDWDWYDKVIMKEHPVRIHNDLNTISFQIQNGPVKENGINGCQVDTLIHAAMAIIIGLNNKFPCKENCEAIDYLGDALMSLKARTTDREQRKVEGFNKK